MSDSQKGADKLVAITIGLIIFGLFFLYLKKSGQLDEIRDSLRSLHGNSAN